MNMLGKAIAITSEAFKDKVDRGGQPYILHCLRVMNDMPKEDLELKSAAVMHDLIEDTDWNATKLYEAGFSTRVVVAVMSMTHINQSYEDYIRGISSNKDAVQIKLADLKDNSDITRLKGLTKKDFDRMEKYHKAYTYLSKI